MFDKDDVNHAFQPVISTKHQRTIGYEALIRHDRMRPEELFTMARERENLYWLDTLSIEEAVKTFNFEMNGQLFLNIFPSTLLDANFHFFMENLMETCIRKPSEVVFEINETSIEEYAWNTAALKERISLLRKWGFVIAIDDVGAGAASMKHIIEYQPDMIKLDRYFSINLSQSESKQEILSLFVLFCQRQNVSLVLEGVEEAPDFNTAVQLNVPLLQGYYTGKPSFQHIMTETNKRQGE